ncbi:potassium voltage-gated channel protein Shaw-like isoform X2 [Mizuhopecten yessoensis]|uniref:potassium voltage-gated channel protein Shaw-like isoform X2 n=1 Tax=Mizuhopecten yessoensis TaxID=6573 RepID=UPI000B45D152|nr:potassium voltage-gated channel protein Shaw-like isoform X2 [Mizuhopecten yessoensis]
MHNGRKVSDFYEEVGATPIRRNGPRLCGDDERILLNVGGVRHETHVATLRNIPCTRLCKLAELHVISADSKRDEYFFDRHPSVFNSVIDFYRTGELHVPLEVCGAVVKRELDYWQVNQYCIKSCCWRHYRSYIENKAILDSFNRSLEKERFYVNIDEYEGWKRFQMKIWLILEHPRTSRLAMIYGVVSLLFVIVSILGFCLESLPILRPMRNITRSDNTTSTCGDGSQRVQVMTQNEGLNILDIICTAYFTIELAVRFVFAPEKIRFVRSMMNIIDLLALVPLYMQLVFNTDHLQFCYVNERLMIEIMFVLRIVRMFRIFHLVKHYQALKILVYALKASVQELLMLAIFLLIGMLVFASMIYYAERKDAVQPSDKFNTIPMGFWWALITMTTVGYGDITPTQPIGYVVGAACAVSGVLMIALTIPVISNNFTLFYTHVRSRGTKEEERDKYRTSRSTCVNNPFRENSLLTNSDEDGYGTITVVGNRNPPEESYIETYMNGHATIKHFSGKESPKYKYFKTIKEATSLKDVVIRNSDFDLHRAYEKARSDDGVTYSEETVL